MRERMTAEIAHEHDLVQRRIAEAMCAAVLRTETVERDLARVETETQVWEAQAMETEETLETLAEG